MTKKTPMTTEMFEKEVEVLVSKLAKISGKSEEETQTMIYSTVIESVQRAITLGEKLMRLLEISEDS